MLNDFLVLAKTNGVELNEVVDLYDNIQFDTDITTLLHKISNWFMQYYKTSSFKATVFNVQINTNRVLYQNGGDFYLDDEFCKTFVVQIHFNTNILISIQCLNECDFETIQKNEVNFDALLFLINPIIKDIIVSGELFDASYKDNITSFYNRKYLDEYLLNILESKDQNKQTTFMMVEVDRFKAVIDEFDYEIGDRVLLELAKIIQNCISELDYVVKLSGYEFLIIIDGSDDIRAQTLAEKIIYDFSQAKVVVNMFTGQTLKKTVCIGYSMYPADHDSPIEVIKSADIALQEAKNIARSTVLKFKKEIESSVEFF